MKNREYRTRRDRFRDNCLQSNFGYSCNDTSVKIHWYLEFFRKKIAMDICQSSVREKIVITLLAQQNDRITLAPKY